MKSDIKIINKLEFPDKLIKIKKVPQKLYAIGNIELLNEESFGIVGTRNPTQYGTQICEKFAKEFAIRDIPVVSGLAIGIDQIAHKTVLECHSKTIGIIGCGIQSYLKNKENRSLVEDIIKNNGLILSEYEVCVESSKENFPERNRIIAGLSEGVLVIEAAYRSGSSITARLASNLNKKVYCVPGRIGDKMSVGTNNLIRKGAVLVTNIKEIIGDYPQFENKKRKKICKKRKKKSNYKKEWTDVVKIFDKESLPIEEIQIKTKKNIKDLLKILSEMELEGILIQEVGKGYMLRK